MLGLRKLEVPAVTTLMAPHLSISSRSKNNPDRESQKHPPGASQRRMLTFSARKVTGLGTGAGDGKTASRSLENSRGVSLRAKNNNKGRYYSTSIAARKLKKNQIKKALAQKNSHRLTISTSNENLSTSQQPSKLFSSHREEDVAFQLATASREKQIQ